MSKDHFEKGSPVWVPHTELAFVRGVVSSRSGDQIKVKTEDGSSVTVDVRDIEYCSSNASTEAKVEDMTQLPDLHHAALLSTLNERFNKDKIYTYTGPILIAVNPFKRLESLYSSKKMSTYLQADIQSRATLKPHAYALAHRAYTSMMDFNGRNQSILVSGESGAGKTETTKIVMSYLTTVSQSSADKRASKRGNIGIAQKILDANPLMEAFGNAKTLRNDNSSRFGKLIQLQFDEVKANLVGSNVDTYLLEKARIIHQAKGERNYHIFYELSSGLSSSLKVAWNFPDLKQSKYTCAGGSYSRSDISDTEQFKVTHQALQVMGFADADIEDVYRMVVAILHLGNVEFDDCHVDGAESSRVSKRTVSSLESCASLLEVKKEKLEMALTTRAINVGIGGKAFTGSESFCKQHTARQSTEARDALAMGLYERMFAWLVWRINGSIAGTGRNSGKMSPVRGRKNGSSKEQVFHNDYSIACLDIFGFEVFEKNCFEQLCINYANETLQQQFNEFVFELEQKEYEAEGVDWKTISYPDNKKCLEMIETKPIGLLSLIDEQCLYPNGSDASLATKLYDNLSRKFADNFIAERKEKVNQQFVINHFAGAVVYTVDGFCYKNKNELRQESVNLMRSSKNEFYGILMPEDAAGAAGMMDPADYFNSIQPKKYRSSLERHKKPAGGSSRIQQKTVGSHFKQQLHMAMSHIRASQPHYVRCLKPNDKNRSGIFDRNRILEQLCYSGVLEVVRVARAGYPTRFRLNEFAQRFAVLGSSNAKGAVSKIHKLVQKGDNGSLLKACEKIVAAGKLKRIEDYQIGHTKVFLRPSAFTRLEVEKAERLRYYVVLIQNVVREFLKTYKVKKKAREAQRAERKRLEAIDKQRKDREAMVALEREKQLALEIARLEQQRQEALERERQHALELARLEKLEKEQKELERKQQAQREKERLDAIEREREEEAERQRIAWEEEQEQIRISKLQATERRRAEEAEKKRIKKKEAIERQKRELAIERKREEALEEKEAERIKEQKRQEILEQKRLIAVEQKKQEAIAAEREKAEQARKHEAFLRREAERIRRQRSERKQQSVDGLPSQRVAMVLQALASSLTRHTSSNPKWQQIVRGGGVSMQRVARAIAARKTEEMIAAEEEEEDRIMNGEPENSVAIILLPAFLVVFYASSWSMTIIALLIGAMAVFGGNRNMSTRPTSPRAKTERTSRSISRSNSKASNPKSFSRSSSRSRSRPSMKEKAPSEKSNKSLFGRKKNKNKQNAGNKFDDLEFYESNKIKLERSMSKKAW